MTTSKISSQLVLSRLDGVKKTGPGKWMALCPGHDDHDPSLSVGVGKDGCVLLKCFAGCKTDAIVTALGLSMSDLFVSDSTHTTRDKPKGNGAQAAKKRKVAATYDYTDERGKLLFQVVRYEPKGFQQRRPGSNDEWEYSLNGTRRVLYRLPDVLAEVERGGAVFIVEGEKDADKLAGLGLTATTCPMGAGKWRDEYSSTLAGAHVVLLPDNDDAGRKHADLVAQALSSTAVSLKVVELPELAEKGDVSDWLDAGGTLERLVELIERAPEYAGPASVVQAAAFNFSSPFELHEQEKILIDGVLSASDLLLWIGHEKQRKSTVLLQVSICLAAGIPFLGFSIPEPVKVLYVDGESKTSDLATRWAGAKNVLTPEQIKLVESNLTLIQGRQLLLDGFNLDVMGDELPGLLDDYPDAEVVVLDPLRLFMAGDENRSDEVTAIFSRLRQIAKGRAVILVHHVRKRPGARRDQFSMRDDPYAWSDNVRGSSALKAHVDGTVMQQIRDDDQVGEVLDLATITRSFANVAPLSLVTTEKTFAWHELLASQDADLAQQQLKDNEREVLDAVRKYLVGGPASRSSLVASLVENKIRKRAMAFRIISKLLQVGILIEDETARVTIA